MGGGGGGGGGEVVVGGEVGDGQVVSGLIGLCECVHLCGER